MQSLIAHIEDAENTDASAQSISIFDAVNWIALSVKQIKAMYFVKLGFEKMMMMMMDFNTLMK